MVVITIGGEKRICYNSYVESQRDTRRPALLGGMNPPDERKEGDANGYIFKAFSVWYVHCRSRWIVLHNLREKKIAATTAIVTAVTM